MPIDRHRVLRGGRRVGELVCEDARLDDARELAELIRLVNAAALDPAGWRPFLDRFVSATGAAWGHLWRLDGRVETMHSVATDSAASRYTAAYDAHFHAVNPTLDVTDVIEPGVTCAMSRVIGTGRLGRSEYWDGMHRAQSLGDEIGISGMLDYPRMRAVALSVLGHRDQFFDARAQRLSTALGPHFAAAAALSLVPRLTEQQLAPVCWRFAVPAIIVDARAHRIEMNDLAVGLWRRCIFEMTFDGLLSARRSRDATRALHGAIADAAATTTRQGLAASATVVLAGPRGERAHVFVTPLVDDVLRAAREPRVLLLVTRLDDALTVLSPTQREVALMIARGATNAEVAEQLGITQETVRSHVKEAFRRLAVRSRMELSRLVGMRE